MRSLGHCLYEYNQKDIDKLYNEDEYAGLSGITKPGYYFLDESYYMHGPFGNVDEAKSALSEYAKQLYLNMLSSSSSLPRP